MLKHYNFRPYRLALPLLSLFLPAMAIGQEWQWAKSGGSQSIIPGGLYSSPEKVSSMAVDPEGNIFSLAPVGISSLQVDGLPKQSYSAFAGDGSASIDYMISSFACDGTLRWAKVLGSPSDDYFKDVRTDAAGNVYTSGYVVNTSAPEYSGIHFDEDQVVEFEGWGTNSQSLYLVKYNNDGELQWVRTPQPGDIDFAVSISQNRNFGVEVDPQGNSYWLCQLSAGTFCDGAYVNNTANTVHMLKYDTDGNFVEGHSVEFEITVGNSLNFKMVRNHNTGVIYIAGFRFTFEESDYVKADGQTVTHSMYLAAFNSSGEALWLKENTSTTMSGHGFDDITLDNEGNIYLTGGSMGNDSFGDVSFTTTGLQMYPIAYKLDAEGNTIWGTHGDAEAAVAALAIAVNGDEVLVTGGGAGVTWDGYSIPIVPNQGYDIFIYKCNKATGQITGLQQIASDFNSWDYGTALMVGNGSLYLGAQFKYHLTLDDNDIYCNGEQSDFLVAKYGTDECYCDELAPSFTVNQALDDNSSFAFEYTGDTDYYTIDWYFGSEGTSTDVNPYYSFSQPGTYEVCVTVSNLCGAIESCQTVNVTAGADTFGLQNVQVYPNPADNVLNINTQESLSFEIVSLLGAKVMSGEIATGTQQVDIQNIASGVYMLKLQNNAGAQQAVKLVVR
jgi:Secretion system C-terminal sorting domain/PKD domain